MTRAERKARTIDWLKLTAFTALSAFALIAGTNGAAHLLVNR